MNNPSLSIKMAITLQPCLAKKVSEVLVDWIAGMANRHVEVVVGGVKVMFA